jgi:DNA polymerase-3 subunit delta'
MSWQRIRGHDRIVREFAEAARKGRIGHAYLFTGPPGVGKRLFADELARTLLCPQATPEHWEACGRCTSCQLTAAGTHPDLITCGRPAEKNEVPIEVVRELCRALELKPAMGGYRVAILDDADYLNPFSANCFLKTLEEPPPQSVLILIATSADLQLPTIVSRCQHIHFTALADDVIADLLRGRGIDDAGLIQRAVRNSGGSPGLAFLLADPDLWQFRRTLVQALGQPRFDSVGVARQWIELADRAGSESALKRQRALLVLRLLIDLLANALRLSVGAAGRGAEPDEVPPLQILADRTGPDELPRLIERCMQTEGQIEIYVPLASVVEGLCDAIGQTID